MSATKIIAGPALVFLLSCGGSPGTRTSTPTQSAAPEPTAVTPKGSMELTSPAFAYGQPIPKQFTGDGENLSPQLDWTGVPDSTKGFALICSDPDAPSGTFIHWVMFNIPGISRGLAAGVPRASTGPDDAIQGRNSFGGFGYDGPKPPPGKPHRYFFKLYALDATITPTYRTVTADLLEKDMAGHVLATAELMGTYQR